jgi:hypothetical protein
MRYLHGGLPHGGERYEENGTFFVKKVISGKKPCWVRCLEFEMVYVEPEYEDGLLPEKPKVKRPKGL